MPRSDPVPPAEAALAAARARTVARVRELTQAVEEIVESSRAANLDDEHDPEGSTVGFERAQIQALLDAARTRLVEIEAARDRLAHDAYGICGSCGAQISHSRLEAQPATRACVDCAARWANPRRPA